MQYWYILLPHLSSNVGQFKYIYIYIFAIYKINLSLNSLVQVTRGKYLVHLRLIFCIANRQSKMTTVLTATQLTVTLEVARNVEITILLLAKVSKRRTGEKNPCLTVFVRLKY